MHMTRTTENPACRTDRQKLILQTVIDEYIKKAFPISSDFLKHECHLNISSATIRLDLAQLSQDGFLQKTHISSGRVPTDKGYRFFVNSFFEKENYSTSNKLFEDFSSIFREIDDVLKLSYELAKNLATASSGLSIIHFEDFALSWKEGWEEVARAPEFSEIDYFKEFMDLVNDFERNIEKIDFKEGEKVKVYIGEELPFKEKRFSITLGHPASSKKKEKMNQPIFAILGPKRMDFKKNIQLIDSLIKAVENFH